MKYGRQGMVIPSIGAREDARIDFAVRELVPESTRSVWDTKRIWEHKDGEPEPRSRREGLE